ncbi:MAG: pantetheine-phosphate adenylyltransferase [Candidatus Roizmanbacteria bacterium]
MLDLHTLLHHVTVGGTFDHFHAGHASMIDSAFASGKRVSIGITIDNYICTKKFSRYIESFEDRATCVEKYIQRKNYKNTYTIIPLHDAYGITLTDITLDGIIVSKETLSVAKEINVKRLLNNRLPLKIVVVPFVKGQDKTIISSSNIRSGLINRTGKLYGNVFSERNNIVMPDSLRNELRNPLGIIIHGKDHDETTETIIRYIEEVNPPMVIAVGDYISMTLRQHHYTPALSIIDGKTKREKVLVPLVGSEASVLNASGTITKSAFVRIKKSIQTYFDTLVPQIIQIIGEEDLLGLPVIAIAPLHSIVLYGLRDEGVVCIDVTEEMKEKTEKLLNRF